MFEVIKTEGRARRGVFTCAHGTVQINEFAEKGSYGIACAFATILIAITYGSVLLMDLIIKFFGTSRKLKEAD